MKSIVIPKGATRVGAARGRRDCEERERRVIEAQREKLARQAAALIARQAEP
jgi:hypothetical protein